MSPANQVFSAFSFIALLLVLIPLPWHLQAWNTGTVIFIGWTAVSLIIFFVNSIVWNGNVTNWSPIWCDISAKLIIGVGMGFPCASLCINRRLYHVAAIQSVTKDRRDKLKGIIVDLSIGLGIPVIIMALHYVVQGHRYDIFEDVGCYPTTYNVTLQYALLQVPALLVPIVSASYAIRSIYIFRKRVSAFRDILSSSSAPSASLTLHRYFRLMALASTEVLIGLPLAVGATVINATVTPVQPWVSWEETHYNFGRIAYFRAAEWRAQPSVHVLIEAGRWLSIVCALLFFAFFGFADEARKNYAAWGDKVRSVTGVNVRLGGGGWRPWSGLKSKMKLSSTNDMNTIGSFGHSPFAKWKTNSTNGSSSRHDLPIYVQSEVVQKRDSIGSFSSASVVSSYMLEKEKSYQKAAIAYPAPSLQSKAAPLVSQQPLKPTMVTYYPSHSTPDLPSSAATKATAPPRPPSMQIEISPAIYPDEFERPLKSGKSRDASRRTSFPVSVSNEATAFPPLAITPEPTSFLEINTPAKPGFFHSS